MSRRSAGERGRGGRGDKNPESVSQQDARLSARGQFCEKRPSVTRARARAKDRQSPLETGLEAGRNTPLFQEERMKIPFLTNEQDSSSAAANARTILDDVSAPFAKRAAVRAHARETSLDYLSAAANSSQEFVSFLRSRILIIFRCGIARWDYTEVRRTITEHRVQELA